MKIGFFEVEGWEEPVVREALPGHDLFFSHEKIDAYTMPETRDFEALSVFTGSRLTDEVFAQFPDLKLAATRSTGCDHVDADAAAARGIATAYVPGYGDNTVAEFAFGLLLAITRNIYAAVDQVKERESFALDGLRGVDLKGKTLGVIGTGRIGKEAVKIAKGFGMQVAAFDPHPDGDFAAAQGFAYVSLEDLLCASDMVTIHCPATPQTFHLINRNNIGLMKQGSYLVNTARGTVVETAALVAALKSGKLRGAALDVMEEEGEVKDELDFLASGRANEEDLKTIILDHELMKMPNALITPHTAFNSEEAVRRILDTTIENIKGFLAGSVPHPMPRA